MENNDLLLLTNRLKQSLATRLASALIEKDLATRVQISAKISSQNHFFSTTH